MERRDEVVVTVMVHSSPRNLISVGARWTFSPILDSHIGRSVTDVDPLTATLALMLVLVLVPTSDSAAVAGSLLVTGGGGVHDFAYCDHNSRVSFH